MTRGETRATRAVLAPLVRVVVLAAFGVGFMTPAPVLDAQDEEELGPPLFNWDIVSLEQNNQRVNGSVLSGFHNVRSPGVTPVRAWKTGLGVLYAREEQVAVTTNTELFNLNRLTLNPKLNYGVWDGVEAGVGFEASWARGKDLRDRPGAPANVEPEEAIGPSAIDAGVKWGFFDRSRWRLALSFDTRVAVNRTAFGALPSSLFNFELDADYALTRRWSAIGNVQFLMGDAEPLEHEAVLDLATAYTFSRTFRGMLFGTVKEDDAANAVLFFSGMAGQYVFEQHSFSLALGFQLNDAKREIRSQSQLDVEFSYTYTF